MPRHDDQTATRPPTTVLVAYGIDTRRTTIQALGGGHATLTWRLDTPDRRLVLHQLADHLTPSQAALATTAHQNAARAGLAPDVLRDRQGGLFTEDDGHRYCVTAFVDDALQLPATPEAVDCLDLGCCLGQLHATLATIPVANRWCLPDDQALRHAAAAHQHPACTHPDAARSIGAKLDSAATIGDPMRQRLDALPQQTIHGDIHPGNILISQDGKMAAVVDFDLARPSPPGYELVRSLIYCVQPAGTPTAYAPRVSEFLRAYFTERPLNSVEIQTMLPLYAAVQILDPYGLNLCEDADPALLAFGQARFALLYWLRCNQHAITTLARHALDDARNRQTGFGRRAN